MKIIVASKKEISFTDYIYNRVKEFCDAQIAYNPQELDKLLSSVRPNRIFFVFWSWKIPDKIIENYDCISFHTAPLPKYRGGSPIQNQILDGKTKSKVTAFRTSYELDKGDIFLQEPISLEGDLKDIFGRISASIISMIKKILTNKIRPHPQRGKPTYCKRRTPEQSELDLSKSARYNYNLVRALNMKPYPHAFVKCGDGKKLYILKAKIEN